MNSLNWSYDNKKYATASNDRKIKVWDAETGGLRFTIPGHIDNICSVVWLPNNTHFISGGIDNHIIMWDLRGEQVEFLIHFTNVQKVSKISSPRVLEIMVSNDSKLMYSVCAATPKIIVTDLAKKTEIQQ